MNLFLVQLMTDGSYSRKQWYRRQVLELAVAVAIMWFLGSYIVSQNWPGWVEFVLIFAVGSFVAPGDPFIYERVLRQKKTLPDRPPIASSDNSHTTKSVRLREFIGGAILWATGLTALYLLIRSLFF